MRTSRALPDYIRPKVLILFVGINPGIRSAHLRHHFAGYSNRFWKLLYESGIVPRPVTYEDDAQLPDWGCGITNVIDRPSRGIDELRPEEYAEGRQTLAAKIRRYQPGVVALLGITIYHILFPEWAKRARTPMGKATTCIGPQPVTLGGCRVFVLPNPSGRNAHYSYNRMLDAYVSLRDYAQTLSPPCL
ncbi:MAG TPA: mismatch-specific DNA-glycosylase [Nitrospiraceae bacterium]|nr:mismatch-specific DNA-glycosylase [Nitrospiraceae bacterium]